MRHKYSLLVSLVLFFIIGTVPASGQEQPLVVMVLNPVIQTASPFDASPDGISTLEEIFQQLGAETRVINLIEAIPDNADVVVIVGPRHRLNVIALARIWLHLVRGNHLLLALDPPGYGNIDTENNRSSILSIITNAYGLITLDGFLAEPWFTKDSASVLSGTYTRTYPDVVPHPVIEPLIRYGLTVEVWGARPVRIEPIGVDSRAVPLLETSTAYAETSPNIFIFAENAQPLEMNLESDIIGRINIAGLAENRRFQSRVAVVGDSEMLQNGYGLASIPGQRQPQHLGNRIFIERLAAWLIGLPPERWPSLPQGYTWIALDGDAADWVSVMPEGRVRALENNAFLYLLLEDVGRNPLIQIQLDNDISVFATEDSVTDSRGVDIFDAEMAVDDVVEIRLPLRIIGEAQISRICYGNNKCTDEIITPVTVNQRDPQDLRIPEGPLVTVTSIRNVALYEQPDTTSTRIATLNAGQVLKANGRTDLNDWIQVETAGYSGWVFASLVVANHDPLTLSVLDTSQP